MIKAVIGPCDTPITIGFATVKAIVVTRLAFFSEKSRTPALAYTPDDEFASVAEGVFTAAMMRVIRYIRLLLPFD